MMKLLLVVLFAFVAVCTGEVEQKIVGGQAASYGDHPYIASLQVKSGNAWYHICGGVIWNNYHVITAAHCLGSYVASSMRVVLGLHRMSSNDAYQVSHAIQSYTQHPSYDGNAAGFPYDIAYMTLTTPITYNSHVSRMHFANSGSFAGQSCKLSGWGRLSGGGSTPSTLQKVNMGKITNSECINKWQGISGAAINAGHICFFDSGKSACSGDSGGPVRCGNLITGITSWGMSNCSGAYPSVYSRVSYFYSWLVSHCGSQ